jgi:hypothetical protein
LQPASTRLFPSKKRKFESQHQLQLSAIPSVKQTGGMLSEANHCKSACRGSSKKEAKDNRWLRLQFKLCGNKVRQAWRDSSEVGVAHPV